MSGWASAPQLLQRGHCRAAVYDWRVIHLLRFSHEVVSLIHTAHTVHMQAPTFHVSPRV